MGEVAAEWLQLRQGLLALQPREPLGRETLHHLEEAQGRTDNEYIREEGQLKVQVNVKINRVKTKVAYPVR